jgi:PAS domain S-box-containing protein
MNVGDARRRSRRRQWWLLLALLALLSAISATVYSLYEYADDEEKAASFAEFQVRTLEAQTSLSLDATAQMLRSLAARRTVRASEEDRQRADRLLEQQLIGQPHLRSLAILDDQGRVLVSTNDADVGVRVDLAALGQTADAATAPRIGPALGIRHLADLVAVGPPKPTRVLPMLQRVDMDDGEGDHWIVALINLEALAGRFEVAALNATTRMLVTDLQGRVAAASGPVSSDVRDLAGLSPFTSFLPGREHGSYVGAGSDGSEVVAAFRLLRQWPLLILVERPLDEIRDQWMEHALAIVVIGAAFIGLLVLLGVVGDRSLRQEDAARAASDRMMQVLADSERRWKQALEGAGHGVWELDLMDGSVSLSPQVARLLDLGTQDITWTGDTLRASIHPDDLDRTSLALKNLLSGETQRCDLEFRVRTALGPWKWVHWSAARFQDGGERDRRQRVVGTVTDIDARKLAELALRESEARQQAILQCALDAVITIDQQGLVLAFNPAAESMFGYPAQAVLGQPMSDLIVPQEHRQAHRAGMARYWATGRSSMLGRRIEIEALRADGSRLPIELSIVAVRTDGGEIFTATMRDITERRRVERALHDSEARERAAFEQAAVGVLQVEPYGKVLRVNEALCQLLGRSREDVLTLHADDLVHPDDRGGLHEDSVRLFTSQTSSYSRDLRLLDREGTPKWVRVTASLMRDDQGKPRYGLGIIEDIRHRRQAEADLEAARQRELQVGARIQKSLLVTPPPQVLDGAHFSSHSLASQGIDGDFVEVLRVGPHCIDVVVGDVMGKGLAAALVGAGAKLQFSRSLAELFAQRSADQGWPEPADIVASVHHAMTPALQDLEAFVTLCYLRIDTAAGRITWVGCGHEEPLLVPVEGEPVRLSNQHPPLGVLQESDYRQDSALLRAGDSLFLCSDGVTDAMRDDGERIGHERVVEAAVRHLRCHPSPAAALHSLRAELFTSGVTLQDDVTMFVIQWRHRSEPVARVELPLSMRALQGVREFVGQQAAAAGVEETERALLEVACVEAFTNIVRHGQGLLADAPLELMARRHDDALVLELVHIGEHFEPPGQTAETNFAEFPEGGFGLTIIRNASDGVQYLHEAGVNTMRMTKRLH